MLFNVGVFDMAKAKNEKTNIQPVSSEETAMSYSPEIGTFYERVFAPEKVRVIPIQLVKPGEKRTWEQAREGNLKLVLEDKNGQTMEVQGIRLVGRVLMYLAPYCNMSLADLKELPADQLEVALNGAMPKWGKEIKGMYDNEGRLQGVASTIHKQIPWSEIRKIIEQAVRDVCGQVVMPEGEIVGRDDNGFLTKQQNRWNYGIPLKNKNVSAWVGVHAGNNIIQGRSGVHLWSRWRTEREGGTGAPACLNWCGMWQVPLKWFNVELKRLSNLTKVLGEEKVEALQLSQFHIRPDMGKFAESVKEQLAKMVQAVEAMQVVIDKSIHSPLKQPEMRAILEAYQQRTNIPEYVIKQIHEQMDKEEESVWGFSQAVSWVRTHGNFKQFRICKDVEDRELTRKLENIAGEVLSLTPTINDIHKKHGDITLDFLIPQQAVAKTA
jgi:hypothetical protein